jgi:hypothetical protein
LSFGRQPRGTVSPGQVVTLTNNSSTPINIADISLGGRDPDEFRIIANTCAPPLALAPGASCTVEIAFTPKALDTRSAELVFTDDAPNSPQSVPLDGVGTGTALVFDPPELEFPLWLLGGVTERQELTLTNVGNEPVTISSFSVSGDFRFTSSCAAALLNKGAACYTRVVFAPSATGPRTGQITATEPTGQTTIAELRGTGGEPVPVTSPPSLSFGDQPIGSTSPSQTITVTNTGTGPLTIYNVQVQGTNPNDFRLGTATCDGAVLQSGQSCSMSVSFAPTGAGTRNASLTFTSSASAVPHNVPLSGTAT